MELDVRLATKLELGYISVLDDLDLDKLEIIISAAKKVYAKKLEQEKILRGL